MIGRAFQAAFAFVFAVVLLDVVAIGAVIPVLPKLIEAFAGNTALDLKLPRPKPQRTRCHDEIA